MQFVLGFQCYIRRARGLGCKYVSIGLGWHVHHKGGVLDFVYNELSRALHLSYEAGKKGMVYVWILGHYSYHPSPT